MLVTQVALEAKRVDRLTRPHSKRRRVTREESSELLKMSLMFDEGWASVEVLLRMPVCPYARMPEYPYACLPVI